jgi:hypothetical protein
VFVTILSRFELSKTLYLRYLRQRGLISELHELYRTLGHTDAIILSMVREAYALLDVASCRSV